ncbi:MAG: Na/Pi symporter [Bacteroidales bacterium]|nr:Na/Pi symporter [Bacteroidales bacterium]
MKRILITVVTLLWSVPSLQAGDTLDLAAAPSAGNLIIAPHAGALNLEQIGICGKPFESPLEVRVTDENRNPAAGITVVYELISQPDGSENAVVAPVITETDSSGTATARFTPGTKPGAYVIASRIEPGFPRNEIIFTIEARRPNWIYMLLIGLLGGLGLFLFGIHALSEGLQKSAGHRMRSILSNVTRNRFVGAGIGTFVTMIIQSSSATSVMLVSFVNAGLMRFRQTIPVLLGAAIGTTITAQLIAFKITEYALLMIGMGFFLQAFSKNEQVKSVGYSVFGFGVLFFGMHIMSDAMSPLRDWPPFINLLINLENPLFGILAGTLLTALIQSSSAFIGIMIVLASQGLLTMEAVIPLILGTNLGTPVTALLASLKTSKESKKVAVTFILIKLLIVIIFAGWTVRFGELVRSISGDASTQRMIANAHTLINVFMMILVLPFTGALARLIDRIMGPERVEKIEGFKPYFLDPGMIHAPILALNLAKQEIIRIANIVSSMFDKILLPFIEKQSHVLNQIYRNEKEVNFLRDAVKEYLLKISNEASYRERNNESFQMIYSLNEFEKIADIISGDLANRAEKWIAFHYEFSAKGREELVQYHKKIAHQLERAIGVFEETNLQKAAVMQAKHRQYRNMSVELERQHYSRLVEGLKESIESSKTHLEILALLSSIDSHATNIARIALEWENNKP